MTEARDPPPKHQRALAPKSGRLAISAASLDKQVDFTIVNFEGRIHCAYLNDHRIAGPKAWGGGPTAKNWKITLREVIRAFPELQMALGLDCFGNRVAGND